jgi:hypothetical protein
MWPDGVGRGGLAGHDDVSGGFPGPAERDRLLFPFLDGRRRRAQLFSEAWADSPRARFSS